MRVLPMLGIETLFLDCLGDVLPMASFDRPWIKIAGRAPPRADGTARPRIGFVCRRNIPDDLKGLDLGYHAFLSPYVVVYARLALLVYVGFCRCNAVHWIEGSDWIEIADDGDDDGDPGPEPEPDPVGPSLAASPEHDPARGKFFVEGTLLPVVVE